MPNIGDLEHLDLNMLAMYCLRVAEDAAGNPSQVEQAKKLRANWVLFIGHAHPPIPGLDSQEDIEAYHKELEQQMVNCLARCSASLFLAKEPTLRLLHSPHNPKPFCSREQNGSPSPG